MCPGLREPPPHPGSLNLGMSRGVGGGLGGVDSRRRATDRGAGECVMCPAQKRRPRQAVSSGALPSRCCWSGRFEPRPVARRGPGPCAAGGWRSVDDEVQTPLSVIVRQSPIACQQRSVFKEKMSALILSEAVGRPWPKLACAEERIYRPSRKVQPGQVRAGTSPHRLLCLLPLASFSFGSMW